MTVPGGVFEEGTTFEERYTVEQANVDGMVRMSLKTVSNGNETTFLEIDLGDDGVFIRRRVLPAGSPLAQDGDYVRVIDGA